MSFSIYTTKQFEKELKRLAKKFPSLKIEFANLIDNLTKSPELGTALGNHCFKIRLSIQSKQKGKSGGARVVTYVYYDKEIVYLLSIYDKSEKSTITQKELEAIIKKLDL